MSFEDAIAQQPQWVQIWVKIMTVVVIGSFLFLLFSKATRRVSLTILLAIVPIVVMMRWLYDTLGYVRLLGLPHVIFWTPLAAYLWWQLSDPRINAPFRQVIWLLLATITVSLAFDYVDVARYLLGERAVLVTSAAGR